MAYQPTQFNEGAAPGLSAAEMNKLGTQYAEVKAELQKTDGSSDIKPHGSNFASDSIPLAAIASAAKTSPGGTEANRLAVTNASGRVGDANLVRGAVPLLGAMVSNLSDIVVHRVTYVDVPAGGTVDVINAAGSGWIIGGLGLSSRISTSITSHWQLVVDGGPPINIDFVSAVGGSESSYGQFAVLPPIRYTSSIIVRLRNSAGATVRMAAIVFRKPD